MSPLREFTTRLVVTPPSLAERRFLGTVVFVGTLAAILFGGQVIVWALGFDQ